MSVYSVNKNLLPKETAQSFNIYIPFEQGAEVQMTSLCQPGLSSETRSNLLTIAPQTIIWLDVEREVVTAGIIQSLSFTHLDKHGIFAINF